MEARAAVPHITKKFAAYIAIAEQGIHRSHFGFCKFFVTFITSTAACMNSMVQRSLDLRQRPSGQSLQ
jgi:hypothetical protein